MARLPRSTPSDLTPDALDLYEKITSGPRGRFMVDAAGGLTGPFNAMLLSPAVGDPLQRLGAAIRYYGTLALQLRVFRV